MPFGPIISPNPGPTFPIADAAPDNEVMKSKPKLPSRQEMIIKTSIYNMKTTRLRSRGGHGDVRSLEAPGVIVEDLMNVALLIEDTGPSVGGVAFEVDPFVPIMKRCCAVLRFEYFQPGIFARRLVKMTVNASEFLILVHLVFPFGTEKK